MEVVVIWQIPMDGCAFVLMMGDSIPCAFARSGRKEGNDVAGGEGSYE
jgi:hypothetical protein